jgi:hypothetical protein
MMIAAIAKTNGCVLVTENERDFVGLDILNPLDGGGIRAFSRRGKEDET